MNALVKSALQAILSAFAEKAVSPENVQTILRLLTAKLRELAEDSKTRIDDVILAFLDGIVTSYEKADVIAAWIQDLLIPNRCKSEQDEIQMKTVLSDGNSDYLETAAWFAGCVLPILTAYFAEKKNENGTQNDP
ncbi:MAG: hypothetical protein J6A23_07110 [Thermoguttaceae bacterium]|nr:hypothetical protein [Thermoguttaceae bacterium]MBP3693644.1 hypothetical protein [Thermoguttaceae bacterium]